MKKKIKDLTIQEVKRTCDKYDDCQGCPLKRGASLCVTDITILDEEYLNSEVYINE